MSPLPGCSRTVRECDPWRAPLGGAALRGPARAVAAGAVLGVLLAPLLGGCGFQPLSLDWGWHGKSSEAKGEARAGGQASAPADDAAAGAPLPPEVQAGQDDLARRVREYADRLERARQERESSQPAAPPRPPALARYEQWEVSKRDSSRLEPQAGGADEAAQPAPGQVIGSPAGAAGGPGPTPSGPIRPEPFARPTTPSPGAPNRETSRLQPPPAAQAPPRALGPTPAPQLAGQGASARTIEAASPAFPPVILASGPVTGLLSDPPAASAQMEVSKREPSRLEPHDVRTATNAGVVSRPPADRQGDPTAMLADAIAAAEQAAGQRPADLRAQLQLRMLYLAAGRTREAQSAWPAGSPEQQRTLAAWVEAGIALGWGQAGSAGEAPGDPTEAALAAVERLRGQLAAQAPLKVRTVRLASRVDGFGVISPFASETYRPGQWVIVYSELDNLTSRLDEDGLYRTELSLRVELLSMDGRSVLEQEDKQVVDRSLNQRRDFFLARRLRLPADLASGHYVLRVSVEDKSAAKVGESMLRFQVK